MIRLANALGAEKLLPETITLKLVPFSLRVPLQHLVGKHGAVVTGTSTIEPRQFSLEGRIYHPGDKERIRQDLDALLAFLMHPPIEVYREHHHDRCLIAYPLGAPQDWIDRGAELALQIPMVAPDPYWYGQEVVVELNGTQVITVDGTAPACPLIKTASSAIGLMVVNVTTDQEILVEGETGVIEVDSYNYTVTVDDVSRLDLVNDDWLLAGFELVPGQNELMTTTPITLTYRPRWY